jgi:hypothetical protein
MENPSSAPNLARSLSDSELLALGGADGRRMIESALLSVLEAAA